MNRILNMGTVKVDITDCVSTCHNALLNLRVLTGYKFIHQVHWCENLEDLKDLRHLFMETFTGYLDE